MHEEKSGSLMKKPINNEDIFNSEQVRNILPIFLNMRSLSMGATCSKAPVSFENMPFGTRLCKEKTLNHPKNTVLGLLLG